MKSDLHVIPENDLREHEETRDCWCEPLVTYEEGWSAALVVHNSADGRELVERHGLQ